MNQTRQATTRSQPPHKASARRSRSNLLARVTPGGRAEVRPRQFYKSLALGALVVIAGLGTGYLYMQFLAGAIGIVWSLIAALVFALFANVASLLGGGWKYRVGVSILAAAALLLPFYNAPWWTVLVPSAAAFILFAVWGDITMRRRSGNMVKFKFFPLARIKIGKLITGLTVVAVILYLPYWTGEIPFLSEDRFGRWYESTAEFIRGPVVGELELSGSVEELAQSIVRRELQQNSDFRQLPPNEQDRAVAESAAQLLAGTEERWNISLGEDRPVSSVAYEYIINKIASIRVQLGDTFLAVWGVVIFFLVRSVGTIFSWAAMLLSYLLYELFAALGIVRLTGENAVKEFVEFT